jgi:hypothetical protein
VALQNSNAPNASPRHAGILLDDLQITPDPNPSEEPANPGLGQESVPAAEQASDLTATPLTVTVPQQNPAGDPRIAVTSFFADIAEQRRSFLQNLFLLLVLSLAAFILTAWILVRVEAPFGKMSTGPQEVVRAQLRALDRGELRPAYDMFSPRYRGQVSFDTWHELFVKHWRMFHAHVVGAETPAYTGPGVTLEIYLHGADDKDYRARFTLIRTDGRWWIDDVHWTQEADEHDVSRT